jgi:hypothetical protein
VLDCKRNGVASHGDGGGDTRTGQPERVIAGPFYAPAACTHRLKIVGHDLMLYTDLHVYAELLALPSDQII